MNNQLRIISVLVGAAVVVLTFTFPFWQPYLALLPGRGDTAILGLSPEISEQLALLPQQQVTSLLELADESPDLARELAIAQLTPGGFVDDAVPEETGQRRAIQGEFIPSTDVVQAEGALTIYEIVDGSHILRLDGLNVTNAPELSLYLSRSLAPLTQEEMEAGGNYHMIQPLQANAGNQNYRIASEIDLDEYNSVVIFSEELQFVVGYAYFQIRL